MHIKFITNGVIIRCTICNADFYIGSSSEILKHAGKHAIKSGDSSNTIQIEDVLELSKKEDV